MNRRFDLSEAFLWAWKAFGDGTMLMSEFRFDPPRRWRFDYAVPMSIGGVAIELEGGEFVRGGGRHQRPGGGFAQDCVKYSRAAELGWAVLRYTGAQMRADPAGCVARVLRTLELRRGPLQ